MTVKETPVLSKIDMEVSEKGSKIHLAVLAGVFATSGSIFGKFAGVVGADSVGELLLKTTLLIVMVTCNTIGCTLFVKALRNTGSTLSATIVSAATNYFASAVLGFLLFGESTSLTWWCGTSLVLLGLLLICFTEKEAPMKPQSDKKIK